MNTENLLNLARELECEVHCDEPLSAHTTFKVGGPCTAMIEVSSEEAFCSLIKAANNFSIRYYVLGNGSNVLFEDKGFDGIIFKTDKTMTDISMINDTTIYAQAGCSLIKLCRFALEHNLSGLEFAYGIPGTVGGAVYMNAGAYNGEIKDIISSVTAIKGDGTKHTVPKSGLDMSYRHSCFENNGEIITSGIFSLTQGNYDDIQDKMVELMGKRRSRQPIEFPSAGSTFKRPKGFFAGKLIEDSGLKGYTVGGAKVSEKHCGFVINSGGATCQDILTVIKDVQRIVQEKTGQFLECEVRVIPYSE